MQALPHRVLRRFRRLVVVHHADLVAAEKLHVFLRRAQVGHQHTDLLQRAVLQRGVAAKLGMVGKQEDALAFGHHRLFDARLRIGGVGQPLPNGNAGGGHDRDVKGKLAYFFQRVHVHKCVERGAVHTAKGDDTGPLQGACALQRRQRIGDERQLTPPRQVGHDAFDGRSGVDVDGAVVGNKPRRQAADQLLGADVQAEAFDKGGKAVGLDHFRAAVHLAHRAPLFQRGQIAAQRIDGNLKLILQGLHVHLSVLQDVLFHHVLA